MPEPSEEWACVPEEELPLGAPLMVLAGRAVGALEALRADSAVAAAALKALSAVVPELLRATRAEASARQPPSVRARRVAEPDAEGPGPAGPFALGVLCFAAFLVADTTAGLGWSPPALVMARGGFALLVAACAGGQKSWPAWGGFWGGSEPHAD